MVTAEAATATVSESTETITRKKKRQQLSFLPTTIILDECMTLWGEAGNNSEAER